MPAATPARRRQRRNQGATNERFALDASLLTSPAFLLERRTMALVTPMGHHVVRI
jgi:hypothetical protein